MLKSTSAARAAVRLTLCSLADGPSGRRQSAPVDPRMLPSYNQIYSCSIASIPVVPKETGEGSQAYEGPGMRRW